MRTLALAVTIASTCALPLTSAAQSQDQIIPASSNGALRGWAGKPWWHALAYCSAVQTRQVDWMTSVRSPEGEARFRDSSISYLQAAGKRVQADRGITYSAALEIVTPKARAYRFALITQNQSNDPAVFKEMNDGCAAIRAGAPA